MSNLFNIRKRNLQKYRNGRHQQISSKTFISSFSLLPISPKSRFWKFKQPLLTQRFTYNHQWDKCQTVQFLIGSYSTLPAKHPHKHIRSLCASWLLSWNLYCHDGSKSNIKSTWSHLIDGSCQVAKNMHYDDTLKRSKIVLFNYHFASWRRSNRI